MSYIKSLSFTTSLGRKYRIVRTDYGESKSVYSAIDTVENQEGKKKQMLRRETLKLFRS